MSDIIAIVAVFNEEEVLADCLISMQGIGIKEIHVFDGAWKHFAEGFASTDATEAICRGFREAETPVIWHAAERMWESQEEKRTFMFHHAGSTAWDYLLIVDADERFHGSFTEHLDQPAYCLYNKCDGPNDLPDIRTTWPNGDYSTEWIPAIRLFRWHQTLRCLWPGGYERCGVRIDVYKPDRNAHGGYSSRIPMITEARFTHHGHERSEEKLNIKRAYYAKIHPERAKRQRAYVDKQP